jgi:hypothetical protein
MSFAVTFAVGKAASHFLTQRQRGLDGEETASVYQQSLRQAMRLAKERKLHEAAPPERP